VSVSVVIVSYNTRDELLRCLRSLTPEALVSETLVVDNASSDGSVEAARAAFPSVRVIASQENLGFSRANNVGLAEARAPYVLVLNSDAELRPGAVEALAAVLDARPDVAVVGPRTLNADGSVQVSFGPALTLLSELRQRRLVRGVRQRDPAVLREVEAAALVEQEPAWVSASCLLARRTALDAIGGFDEGFFLYEEDVDLCVRLRAAGWSIVFTPTAEVLHHLGRSMERTPWRARLEYHRSHLRYYRKHNGWLATTALRALLLASGIFGWLASLRDPDAHEHYAAVVALTLRS
jgi:N-acetylglucosaminyl-diphospho-decaprenol L-rhamnosyltransferase